MRCVLARLAWAAVAAVIGVWSPRPLAVAAYTDLGPGYICTDKAFEEGGYEPTDTGVGPGSEPLLKAAIVKLLGAE